MAIPLRGTVKQAAINNGSDITLTFDVGAGAPQTGDIVLLFGGHGNDGSSAGQGPNTSGYTQRQLVGTTGNIVAGFWYKVMGATPDTDVVCEGGGDTGDAVAYKAIVLDGSLVDAAIFDNADVVVNNSGAAAAHNPGAITVNTAGAWVIVAGIAEVNDATPGTPTNYTDLGSPVNANDTDPCSLTASYREIAAPGAEDPGAIGGWINVSNVWFTVAIKPAAALADNIDPDLIASTTQVFTPIGIGTFLSPALIASALIFFTPDLLSGARRGVYGWVEVSAEIGSPSVTLDPDYIDTNAQVFSPQIATIVTPTFIASGEQVPQPQIGTYVDPGFIAPGAQAFSPDVVTSPRRGVYGWVEVSAEISVDIPVNLDPGFIASTATVPAPGIGTYVDPGFIAPASVVSNPDVMSPRRGVYGWVEVSAEPGAGVVNIAPGLIPDMSTVFSPSVGTYLDPGFIAPASIVFDADVTSLRRGVYGWVEVSAEPGVGYDIVEPSLLADTNQVFSPEVVTLDARRGVYGWVEVSAEPSEAPDFIDPDFIAPGGQVFAADLNEQFIVVLGATPSFSFVAGSSLGIVLEDQEPTNIDPGFIASTALVGEPDIGGGVAPGFIVSSTILYTPEVGRGIAAGFIASTAIVPDPDIGRGISAGFIASTAIVPDPDIIGPLFITPALIGSSVIFFVPTVHEVLLTIPVFAKIVAIPVVKGTTFSSPGILRGNVETEPFMDAGIRAMEVEA